MKQMKKWISVILAVLMMTAVLPTAFAASDDVIATGTGGEGITWTLTEGGLLTVSGNGPIVDEEEAVIDEDGTVCTSKIDCLGWQIDRVLNARTEGMDAAETARARIDLVKELVIEEGITEIPGGEFDIIYPRRITLPSTLTFIGNGSINAMFADTLTVNSKDLLVSGGVVIAGHNTDTAGCASVDEAIATQVAFEAQLDVMEKKMFAVYDLGAAYELKCGIDNDLTEAEYLANFNEYYGTDFATLDACIPYCIERINADFGTQYTKVDEVYTLVQTEDGSYAERDALLDEKVTEMYEAADIEDSLSIVYLGEECPEDVVAYTWLTVYGLAGSNAEESANISGVPFVSTDVPDNSFLGKIKRFFAPVKAFFIRIYNWIKFYLSILKK